MEPLAPPKNEQIIAFGRRPLMLGSIVAVAALLLLAAGCGGGDSPAVASIASSTTAATTTPQTGAVAFARCMQSHGVPGFPDPERRGAFDANTLKQLRVGKFQMRTADSHCSHLLPNGLIPTDAGYTITRADQLDYLKGAACMRRHGFADFPDPTFQNDNIQFDIPSSIDQDSSQFKSAAVICQRLIPAGLPYSGSS